jgi:hypothetical protein
VATWLLLDVIASVPGEAKGSRSRIDEFGGTICDLLHSPLKGC